MNHLEKGEKIARAIFEYGEEPDRSVTRIQYMTGKNPERALGGLCESALAAVISRMLAQLERK